MSWGGLAAVAALFGAAYVLFPLAMIFKVIAVALCIIAFGIAFAQGMTVVGIGVAGVLGSIGVFCLAIGFIPGMVISWIMSLLIVKTGM